MLFAVLFANSKLNEISTEDDVHNQPASAETLDIVSEKVGGDGGESQAE